ncbi:MAG: cytidylate kinase-like family protein [Bacteroidaceae bacterium]|nr:cytidylate kinase-like family protein [Bacteroidaceae bacterium]
MEKFVINVGRQLGSGGREVSAELAKRLDISYFDKELLNVASEESGLCKEFFEKADEKASQPLTGGLFGLRFPFSGNSTVNTMNYLSNDALFQIQSDAIRKLAEEKSCLFIGRCADYVLRDNPRCVNIFISASLPFRIERIARLDGISAAKAEEKINHVEKRRAEYYNYYSNKRWGAAESYHLCIDSSVLGIAKTTDFIEQFIRAKLGL